MSLTVIVIGAGGHAKVLLEVLRLRSVSIAGIVDADSEKKGSLYCGVPVLGGDSEVRLHRPGSISLVNGIGSVKRPDKRREVFYRFKAMGYEFLSVIHPSAVIASDALLSEGAQVMAGSIIQPGCTIGLNSIINTRASVDHDCSIGDNVHLAPGVTLSGSVKVGSGAHIGAGAVVIHGVTIGENSVVGAGAAVIRDIPGNTTFIGVPAREVSK